MTGVFATRAASAATHHEWLRANLIIAFYTGRSRDSLLSCRHLNRKYFVHAQELALILPTASIADVFGFASVDNNGLSVLKATFHIVIVFGYASAVAWRNRAARLLLYLSVACVDFEKNALSVAICQVLSPIAQGRLFITPVLLLMLVVRFVLHGKNLTYRGLIDGLLLLLMFLILDFCLLYFLESSFFCDGVVDECAPFLQSHDSLIQIGFMEVSSRKWTHILLCRFFATPKNFPQLITVNLKRHCVIQTDQLLRLKCIYSTWCASSIHRIWTIQTLHAVNSYEVGHASVHLFSFKKLKCKVVVWGQRWAIGLRLKIFEIYNAEAHVVFIFSRARHVSLFIYIVLIFINIVFYHVIDQI